MSAYERAMGAERARLAAAARRNADFARQALERETGMSAELDRAFELAFEAGRDTDPLARIAHGGADKKRKREADDVARCALYVRGLPLDVTFSKVETHFSKCGEVRRVKLYKDAAGKAKGDALVIYKKEAAASRALAELHGTDLFGYVLDVVVADFATAGGAGAGADGGEPSAAERIAEAIGQRRSYDMEQLRVVVLSNAFCLEDVASAPDPAAFLAELEDDMWQGCKQAGALEAVRAFPSDPACCCAVRFAAAKDAAACVRLMDGRVYNGRVIAAAHWDGNLRRAPPAGNDDDRLRRMGGGAVAASAPPPPPPPPPPPSASAPAAPQAPPVAPDGAPRSPAPAAAAEAPRPAAALASLPSADKLACLSVRELRALLRERAIDAAGCVEKGDLVERLTRGCAG
ncbi:hypothetical protein KFE25_008047 [Diacronema lutheri]|uniref:RRM domain-containing protein n=1 Tax=Diacronema lutheri TaxID=2081491 RepID=A0A8J5XGG1_DIALT|nr:hypothetical protein KFE25_008047 [Diacronema lutheri]